MTVPTCPETLVEPEMCPLSAFFNIHARLKKAGDRPLPPAAQGLLEPAAIAASKIFLLVVWGDRQHNY
jgi:hypothetical protein